MYGVGFSPTLLLLSFVSNFHWSLYADGKKGL